MNKNEITELIKKINSEPSVLFLGQNYLNYDSRLNYYTKLQENLGYKVSKKKHFSDIFSESVKDEKQITQAMDELSSSLYSISWLKNILNMRWTLIYTSAIDGLVCKNCNATPILEANQLFKEEFARKHPLHLVELFGNVGEDSRPAPKKEVDIAKTSCVRLSYITNIVEPYGVLVVDGWGIDDWLTSDDLFNIIKARSYPGTYLFGISETALLDSISNDRTRLLIKDLIDSHFIFVEENGFAQELQGVGYFEMFEQEEEIDSSDFYSITFFSNVKNKIPSPILLRKECLRSLSNNITLIHDDLVGYLTYQADDIESDFVRFLTQGSKPNWHFYSNNPPFIFKRKIEDELLNEVKVQLGASTYNRKAILLEGVSNSGKTVILTKLALRINKELSKNPAIVFFISGIAQGEEWKENLNQLIKDSILKKTINDNQIINRVILICDDIGEDISVVQTYFQEDNVLVVGSSYLHTSTKHDVKVFTVDSELNEEEISALNSILNKFDDSSYASLSKRKQEDYRCIFEILSNYARFKHDKMWISVEEHIKGKLKAESQHTESDTGLTFFSKTQDYMLKNGIGASVLQDLAPNGTAVDDSSDLYVKKIKLLNCVLAASGQFGKKLPFNIVLKILKTPEDPFDVKVNFFKKLLTLDSMAEFELDEETGKYSVKFRNPSEAYAYLKLNFLTEDERHENEIKFLREIICACNWFEDYSEETKAVIDLIRCFGSNSFGRPFEDNKNVASEYEDYWVKISDSLKEANALKNGEALIVYCHFLRESLRYASNKDEYTRLFEAYDSLVEYIDNHESFAIGYGRKYRVCGEICANLNTMMQEYNKKDSSNKFISEFDVSFGDFETAFNNFTYYFSKMNKYAATDKKSGFDTNFQLDIWLNAVENFKKNGLDSENAEIKYHELMLRSMEYIGSLLNCNTHDDISRLLNKVIIVFNYFKKENLSFFNARQLEINSNDSQIYLDIMKPFFEKYEDVDKVGTDDSPKVQKLRRKIMNRNKVLVFLNELSDNELEDKELESCKEKALKSAEKVVEYFEKDKGINFAKAVKCKSDRCIYIYLKSLWLKLTGCLLLEIKQQPKLSCKDWEKIKDICDCYLRCFASNQDYRVRPAALLLLAYYNWVFNPNADYKSDIGNLLELCSTKLGSQSTFVRLGVCKENGELCEFKIAVDQNLNERCTASIDNRIGEYDNKRLGQPRKKIYMSDETLRKIFYAKKPHRIISSSSEAPVVNIWFNGKNPQISLPERKAGDK